MYVKAVTWKLFERNSCQIYRSLPPPVKQTARYMIKKNCRLYVPALCVYFGEKCQTCRFKHPKFPVSKRHEQY
jgi:hypothetical protein